MGPRKNPSSDLNHDAPHPLRQTEIAWRKSGRAGFAAAATEASRRLSFIYRRQGDYAAAVAVWEQAADGRQIYAHVELAKFYEHKQRDPAQAKQWTEVALSIVTGHHPHHPERRQWLADLQHRLARLERKVAGQG